jgi:polyphosphate glucokinase
VKPAMGIDVGGSGIKGAVVDPATGDLLTSRIRVATPSPSTPRAVARATARLVARAGWDGPLGFAIPSVVRHGVVHTAANIASSWIGTDAVSLIETATGLPTAVVNDADAAGLAEMRVGASRGRAGVVLLLTFGTGIGSALFVDGSLVPNTELGHLVMWGGSAEARAGAAAKTREELSWAKWARRVDRYLAYVERLFWPDLLIVGGGVSRDHQKWVPLLHTRAEVLPARFRNNAGIVGAALLAAGRQPG